MKFFTQILAIMIIGAYASCQKDMYNDTMVKVDYSTNIKQFDVEFINHSLRADSFMWDFGDGNTSNLVSPTHTYRQSDFYSITLRAYKDGKIAATKSSMIIVGVIANFIHQVASDGLTVSFINRSENVASVSWNFGDGSISSDESPMHKFSLYGTKMIELTVNGTYGGEARSRIPIVLAPPLNAGLSEWDKVNNRIEKSPDNIASKMELLKVAIDEKYLSFYCQFEGLSEEELKFIPVGFFIDVDGNPVTGNQGIYGAGCDLFIDGPIFSGTGSMFDSNSDGASWDWKNYRPTTDRVIVNNLQTLSDGKVAVVISILRSEMPQISERVGFGLSFAGSSWGFTMPWTNNKAYYYITEDVIKFEKFPN